ncbi:Tyrosine 2,3-aminomutase [Aquicella siphonis]|uniref:Tyrosine 2,3-aminomutase n=1 Tax=Aquicella siphonis TaxID=254247 RepID=A0A5E4PLB9_9COXI|nr:aromatic amino acid ammonia-lyase [Aquicella siphonis]VVC77177.1 Tyrosine 2,3-aminomutase [Aquicella siphonis]
MLNTVKKDSSANTCSGQDKVIIGSNRKLLLSDVKRIAQYPVIIDLSPDTHDTVKKSYEMLKLLADKRIPVYGMNTNFGDQVRYMDTHLKCDNSELYYASMMRRQINIIKSLACSQGQVVTPEIIRVTMTLRAHCLAQGYSGVSPDAIATILSYLNAGIAPVVRCYGSIGASGDLIPLASIAACFLGENVEVSYQGKIMPASEAMKQAGIGKLRPQLRDGLALINGTSFMTAIASTALYDLNRLFTQTLSAVAMSLESMLVISSAYHPLVHQLKFHKGENSINDFILNFWEGSLLISNLDELRTTETAYKPVQDYYSLRAVPQGFGPLQENLSTAVLWVENEMNSVNDNPIVDAEENQIHHTANFMGYYITEACDLLKADIAQASTWIHALLANMLHPRKNHGLPVNLTLDPDNHNGFRSMQLLSAALAVQNRKLAQSQQAFSLPTEGDNQDVSSLGAHAAFDLRESVMNLERLTAVLLLASAQALELRGIQKASLRAQEIHQVIRAHSPVLSECRPMSAELTSIVNLLQEELI